MPGGEARTPGALDRADGVLPVPTRALHVAPREQRHREDGEDDDVGREPCHGISIVGTRHAGPWSRVLTSPECPSRSAVTGAFHHGRGLRAVAGVTREDVDTLPL